MASEIPLTSVGGREVNRTTDTTKKNTSTASRTENFDRENDATDTDPLSEQIALTTVSSGFNSYRYKKTLTQGLMDISLFSANANQLRYILEYGSGSNVFSYVMSSLIALSLILQVIVGVLLLLSIKFNVEREDQRQKVYEYGNNITIAIFLITVINIFVAAFGGTIDLSTIPRATQTEANNRLIGNGTGTFFATK